MHFTARTPEDFLARWDDRVNFLLGPELIPFDMPLPSAEDMVDILRRNEKSRVQYLAVEDEAEREALTESFRTRPLEEALETPFSLANFYLQDFYGAGQFLEAFQERIMIPWRTFLASNGFTWQRCYPIVFISGKGCSSTYHVDISHVLAWQVHGEKHFHGYRDPESVLPIEECVENRNKVRTVDPPDVDETDLLTYHMKAGDVLWNQLLTPHWVTAGEDVAVSINISHGGVQHRGAFCPNEKVLRARWEKHPDEAWRVDERY